MRDNTAALQTFAEDLRQEIISRSERDQNETFRRDAFTSYLLELLDEAGEIDAGTVCHFRARGIEVDGYAVNNDEDELSLFVSIHTQSVPPATVLRSDLEAAFRRLGTFFVRARDGLHQQIEEASPAFDMALRIQELAPGLRRLRLFVLTDGRTTVESTPAGEVAGVPAVYQIWDVERLRRFLSSGQTREPIEVDFQERFGRTLPCLPAPEAEHGYRAYLVLVPGEVLHDLYDQYGARLLELNVRSFLQARGKVNAGIRDTLLKQPTRFLAYNNGISATADEVELSRSEDGGVGVRRVRNFQIVNGGQTTASIHRAARRDGASLSGVHVQAKLVEVPYDRVGEIVPLISRYSNSQNRIQEADFSANDPFHVAVEAMSRTVWAPAADGTTRQTRWFYERARGQYQEALARETTPARRRDFRLTHPPAQTFSKTDLAKFENTWDELPHIVSLGAQKSFREFTLRLNRRGPAEVDVAAFHRIIARAILFRRTERIVQSERFGGYRANIVTYTLSYLLHRTARRIDLDAIWRMQDLPPALAEVIRALSRPIAEAIMDAPGGGNVTEWAKKEKCWDRVRSLDLEIPPLDGVLLSHGPTATPVSITPDEPTPEQRDALERVAGIPAEVWLALAGWAKQTGSLQSWQRGIVYDIGRRVASGRSPSPKQAYQGMIALDSARQLGFREPEKAP